MRTIITVLFFLILDGACYAQQLTTNAPLVSINMQSWIAKFGKIEKHLLEERNISGYFRNDIINIDAEIIAGNIPEPVPIYMVIVLKNKTKTEIFAKSNGTWVSYSFDKPLLVSDVSTLPYKINLLEGFSNFVGTAEFYIGFDYFGLFYNVEPFVLTFNEDYNRIITVGKKGDFVGCDGLKLALNTIQNTNEIRVEKGVYTCENLVISEAKSFNTAVKISGGWNSSFEKQTGETTFEVPQTCSNCSISQLEPSSIFKFKNKKGFVYLENFIFKNNLISGDGMISGNGSNLIVDNNQFFDNFGFGTVINKPFVVTNSLFRNNSGSNNLSSAVNRAEYVLNNQFIENKIVLITDSVNIKSNVFDSNGKVLDNLDLKETFFINNLVLNNTDIAVILSRNSNILLNNTFVNNFKGGILGGGFIFNTIFSDSPIISNNLTIDYSILHNSSIKNGANLGEHFSQKDPLFVNPEQGDFSLQEKSPAINNGLNDVLDPTIQRLFNFTFFQNEKGVFDLNGNLRLNKIIDIGAYEF